MTQESGWHPSRSKPSWYIVVNNDQKAHPDPERFAVGRMGTHTYDIDSSELHLHRGLPG